MTDANQARARNFRLGTAKRAAQAAERLRRYDQLVDTMSQAEAAAALGITLRTTQDYEAALRTRPLSKPPAGRRDTAFMEYGACRTADPNLFLSSQAIHSKRVEDAKRVCDRCPVEDACLAWAMDTNQVGGVWGGKTDRERDKLREQHQGEP